MYNLFQIVFLANTFSRFFPLLIKLSIYAYITGIFLLMLVHGLELGFSYVTDPIYVLRYLYEYFLKWYHNRSAAGTWFFFRMILSAILAYVVMYKISSLRILSIFRSRTRSRPRNTRPKKNMIANAKAILHAVRQKKTPPSNYDHQNQKQHHQELQQSEQPSTEERKRILMQKAERKIDEYLKKH